MEPNNKAVVGQFIVRRAFRAGRVTRADVIAAFHISTASATRFMARAEAIHTQILMRDGHALVPRPLAEPPAFASEADLLKQLDAGRTDFSVIGLTVDELPVHYVHWTQSMPLRPGILSEIVTAIRTESILQIVYLGLRKNEQPKARLILPLGLERMNDQWRVIAQDIEKEGYPTRIFVLPRILEAKPSRRRKPKGLVIGGTHDKAEVVLVALNGAFTDLQKKVIAHELKVTNGAVRVPSRSVFEFLRRFTDQEPNNDAVWPPLIKR